MKKECPNHLKQPLYCVLCDDDEDSTHDHKAKLISLHNNSIHKQWLDFRQELLHRVANVNQWVEKYKGLLELLTRVTEIDSVQRSIDKLRELVETVSAFYDSDV